MMMSVERAFGLHGHDIALIEPGCDLGAPMLRKTCQLLFQVDGLVSHCCFSKRVNST